VKPVVVVGASLAGLSAAHSMRATGFTGEVVVLDAAAELPVDRPPLSKQVLSGEWDLDRAQQPMARRIGELALDVRLGTVATGFAAAGLEVLLDSGETLEAAGAVLATGASPRRLPGPERGGLHVLRTGTDARSLRADVERGPARVVVVGAGFIGAEVAATCRALGLAVTMVEAGEAPLVRALPIEVGRFVADLHRRHGVDVRLGTGISEVVDDEGGRVRSVRLDDGTEVDCDVVVLGIGVEPSVGWLEGSGIPLLEASLGGGVRCDSSLLAAPGVVAAGDLAAWPNPAFGGELMRVEHWESAIDQGAHAGRRLLAELGECTMPDPAYASLPWFWSDQYDAKIQMVGRAGPEDEVVVVDGTTDGERFVALLRRGDECRAVIGVNRPRLVVRARMRMAESRRWADVEELFG
jgi:NADPH-dependent 2,4-dienoyl-CoA reductase/sulfur reductase-like enzyme